MRLDTLNTRTGPSFLNRLFSHSVLHQSKISRGFAGEGKLLDYLGDHNICGIDRARAHSFSFADDHDDQLRSFFLRGQIGGHGEGVCVFLPESRWQFHFAKFSYTVS